MGLQGDIVVNVAETSAPAVEPVTLADAFFQSSVDDDIAADLAAQRAMTRCITMARDYCENCAVPGLRPVQV